MNNVEKSDELEEKVKKVNSLKAVVLLNKWYDTAMLLLLFGMSPVKFIENTPAFHRIVIGILVFLQSGYSLCVIITAPIVSKDVLFVVTHWYISMYCISFNYQWIHLLLSIKHRQDHDINFADFYSTRKFPDVSGKIIKNNYKGFLKLFTAGMLAMIPCNMLHTCGPFVEAIVRYFKNEPYITLRIFPPVIELPEWGNMIIFICNTISMWSVLIYCIAACIIQCIRSFSIKAQCEIIGAAIQEENLQYEDLTLYLIDHINIIKKARALIELNETMNSNMFFIVYFSFAIELLSVSLLDVDDKYFAFILDFIAMFFDISSQCILASFVTSALQDLGNDVYSACWFNRNKSFAQNIQLMIQTTQKTYIQKIWFGSVNVERGTILSVLRSSYSVYTLLMILQSHKDI